MKIMQHISVFFLTPVVGIIAIIGCFPIVKTEFPWFITFYPFVAMLVVLLLSFATHFLNVSCPKCNKKLKFNLDFEIEKPRYQCNNCHFERKGFFK